MYEKNTNNVGIFPGDIIIKTSIELAIKDIIQNDWLVDDIFGAFYRIPILKNKYGPAYVKKAKDYFKNNEIKVLLGDRIDVNPYPCIIISVGNDNEENSLSTLGDGYVETTTYSPSEVGSKIPFIVPPFYPESYDKNSGELFFPESISEFQFVSDSMMVLDTENCQAYQILSVNTNSSVTIESGLEIGQKVAVIPPQQVLTARREMAKSNQSYELECATVGDSDQLIMLYSMLKYILYRYTEGILENNGFQNRSMSAGPILVADNAGQHVWIRKIRLTGIVEESWVKTPMGNIEAIGIMDTESTEEEEGVKILTNEVTFKDSNGLWVPKQDDYYEE